MFKKLINPFLCFVAGWRRLALSGQISFLAFYFFPVVLPISVTISIAVSIPIPVAPAFRVNAVEDERHVAELAFAVKLLHVGQLAAVELAGARHDTCICVVLGL